MTLTTTGGAALTNLTVSPRTDANTGTTLPSLTVAPGGTVPLTITSSGLSGSDTYRFVVMGTKKVTPSTLESMTALTGVKNSAADLLSIAPSAGFTTATTGGSATYSGKTIDWSSSSFIGGTTNSRTFNISVPAGTTPDVYSLTVRVLGTGANEFGVSQEIFLNVASPVPEPATLAMLLGGGVLVGLVCWRGRKRIAAAAAE
jgi:hypothetical protein